MPVVSESSRLQAGQDLLDAMGTEIHRTCSWCGGSGEVDAGPTSPAKAKCSVCAGRGYSVMDSDTIVCPLCEGSGEACEAGGLLDVILGHDRPCPACKGTGWTMPSTAD